MVEVHLKPIQLVLVLHTAVDYLYRQGAGIGVVQRAECATTGIINNQYIPGQERKYGIVREKLNVENIKTAGRAQMLALVYALGLAQGTIKRGCPKAAQVQQVTVFSDSPKAVQTINHHIKHAPKSLQDLASSSDYSIIKRVIARVRQSGRKGKEDGEAKGRKACQSRRKLQLALDAFVDKQEEAAVADEEKYELVIRPKHPPKDTEHEPATVYNE